MEGQDSKCGGQDSNRCWLAPTGSNPFDLKCGGQDSNLRTDKDCDLNAAPLTKLGDPRGYIGLQLPLYQTTDGRPWEINPEGRHFTPSEPGLKR